MLTSLMAGEPILKASPNTKTILGFPESDLVDPNSTLLFTDLIHDDDVADYLLESQEFLFDPECNEKVLSYFRMRTKQNNYVWLKDTLSIIRQGNDEPQLLHLLSDVSTELTVRQDIQDQKERLTSLLKQAGFGLWEWSTHQDFFECDDSWSRLIGFPTPVLRMKMTRFYALIHPENVIELRAVINNLVKAKIKNAQVVVRVRHLSGSWRYHQCNASLIQSQFGDHKLISMSHKDITREKENEVAAVTALATRNQFFARVSHEIRTPLHAILGMLSLVKKELNENSAREKIDKVVSNSEHLLYLLNDILDLAKLNEAKLKVSVELTSVSEVINQVARLFSFKAEEKNIKLLTELPSLQYDMVMSDKVRVTQVLSNLVSNAIKYTHKGDVKIYTKLDKDSLILCVQDSGIGIKNTKDIFDAYRQEESGYEQSLSSTGLGLEIVKKLCDLLGIEIKLHSNASGTLFELKLGKPMNNTQSIKALPIEKADAHTELEGLRVLVVDDSDINREIVAEMLSDYTLLCDQASDGYSAVKTVNNDNAYDVVLMDKHMPNMNGIDATRQIRMNQSLDKQPIIIAVTADAFDIDSKAWFEAGLNEIITKPFEMNILLKTIKRCVKRAAKNEESQ